MKKTLTLILVVLMLVSMAGCGSGATPAATTATPAASATTEASASSAAASPEPEPALESVKLVWYSMMGGAQRDQDEVFAAFSDYVASKINATVEIIPLEWGTYTQKLQTSVIAGDEIDLCWISDWMDPKYLDFVNKGAIVPLDDLLANYAPKTKAFIDQNIWDFMKVDGKIYGVPCYQGFYRQNAHWVKKDLADKYGFDPKAFKTYKDLEPFFDQILANETDIVPYAVNGGWAWNFQNGMGAAPDRGLSKQLGAGLTVYQSDPTTVVDEFEEGSISQQDAYAGMLAGREWYLKKYVRQDLLSIQDLNAEVKTGKYACGWMMYGPDAEVSFKDRNGFEVYAFPTGKPVLSGVTATELAITASSRNPERAMMLIELLMNDPFAYNLIANGIENKHYIKTADNRISRVENNGYQPNMNWAMGNTFLQYLVPGQPDNYNDIVKATNEAAEAPFMPDWNYNNEKVKNEEAASAPLWDEFGTPLFAGVLDPAKYYPEYVEKLKKAGHDVIVAEIKAQFDAYLASKK